jgi:NADH-quinone oxidoreductase subunit J
MRGWLLIAEEVTDPADAVVGMGERITQLAQVLVSTNGRLMCACILAALGLWFLLPKGKADFPRLGMIVSVLAGCFFASLFKPLGDFLATSSFCVLASITVVSAVSTIVSRSPVYCAIWFAVTLLGTGGLFLLNGGHFLGVATVAVYAGAIVVTFLFVLMLAQPEGHAFYDRVSWGGTPTALAVLAGLLIVAATVWNVGAIEPTADEVAVAGADVAEVLADQHVAALGGILFSKHLIAIQVAGTLLLAALVGAVAIAGRDQIGRTVRAAAARPPLSAATHRPGSSSDV